MLSTLFKVILLFLVTFYLLITCAFLEVYKNEVVGTVNNTYAEIYNVSQFKCSVFCVDELGRPDLKIKPIIKFFLPDQYTVVSGGKLYTFGETSFSFVNILWLPILNLIVVAFIWMFSRSSGYTRID